MEFLLVGAVCAAGIAIPVVMNIASARRRRIGPPGR
jgi:hypothetical protein